MGWGPDTQRASGKACERKGKANDSPPNSEGGQDLAPDPKTGTGRKRARAGGEGGGRKNPWGVLTRGAKC